MNRRSFLKSFCTSVGCLVSTSCGTVMGRSAGKRPDVLFIAIDDMNDWTTLFDPKNPIKTPNLVRLAKRGMFFSKAYCAAPACCPSRAAIMTGIRPSNSGVYDNNHAWAKMMPEAVTLSRYFMLNGYETFGAGKRYKDGSQELYDHARDPWEWNNLAAQPEYAEVIDEHKKWLPANEQ